MTEKKGSSRKFQGNRFDYPFPMPDVKNNKLHYMGNTDADNFRS